MVPDHARDGILINDAEAITDAAGVHIEAGASRPTATWSDWSCTVRLVVSDPKVLNDAVALVRTRMRQVERVASRFVVDSDLNWANANSGRPIAVPSLLIELVEAALDGARRSDGALDPTIGRHLSALGYDRDILLVRDDDGVAEMGGDVADGAREERDRVLAGPSGRTWRNVVIDRQMGLLTVPRGTALDLGATAKAQTADWTARAVHQRYGVAVMVEIGGDLAVAGHLVDKLKTAMWPTTRGRHRMAGRRGRACRAPAASASASCAAGWPRRPPRSGPGAEAVSGCTTSSIPAPAVRRTVRGGR